MPILDCENIDECRKNGIRGTLHMQTRACRFSPFQEVKIQEMVTRHLKGEEDYTLTRYDRLIKSLWGIYHAP